MNKNTNTLTLLLAATLSTSTANVHAFGIGDLIGAGVQVGAKVIGAGVDKLSESLRDKDAEEKERQEAERKQIEAYNLAIAEVENRKGLTPYQREKGVLAIKRQYEQMAAVGAMLQDIDARQRAERDQIFTPTGMLNTVGEAAMNTPSVAMYKADVMVKTGIPQAQSRASIAKTDALLATGIPQQQNRATMARVDAQMSINKQSEGSKAVLDQAYIASEKAKLITPSTEQAQVNVASLEQKQASVLLPERKEESSNQNKPSVEAVEADTTTGAGAEDAFKQDSGKKIFVSFVNSPSESSKFRALLNSRGYTTTDSPEMAEVTYVIEGEFWIKENKRHDALVKNMGELLEDPTKVVEPPERKTIGAFFNGINSMMVGIAMENQGMAVPDQIKQGVTGGYMQNTLLVIARQPREGKESRFSVAKEVAEKEVVANQMAISARNELYAVLGLTETSSEAGAR